MRARLLSRLRTLAFSGWLSMSMLAGCGSEAAPTAPTTGITLSLTGATVGEAVAAFAAQTGEPLVTTPAAERYAGCVRLSLLVPAPRPAGEVASLLDAPLHAEGFSLTRGATGWTLTHEGAVPTGCAEPERADRAAPPAPAPMVGGPPPPPIGPVGETHAEIPRADLDAWLGDPTRMMSEARVIPDELGGVIIGMRVYGIRRSSMMGRLGFQNGDAIYSVNGYAFNTPENLEEAYAHLRSAEEYRVDMVRQGQRLLHVIQVIDP